MAHKKSLYAYLFSCAFIFAITWMYPNWNNTGPNATLSWDVMGYYSYLPAGLIYQDFTELKYREDIQNKYHPSGLHDAAYLHESGSYVMKYPVGMSLAYLPWFSLAHVYAKISDYPPDGFSQPYHVGIAFGCLVYAFLGLWFLRKILLRYFSDSISAITLLLIALGTNYLNYAAFDMAMPHNFIFTLYAILIWTTIRWYEKPTFGKSIVIGICIGWAALARPTEIVSAIIPVLWGLSNWESVRERIVMWKTHFGKLVVTAFVIGAIGMLQILYWKITTGSFLVYSYQDQGFTWNGVHLKDCFFSYRKGWLVYTPLMFFSIIGFIFYWKKNLPSQQAGNTLAFSEKNFWAVFLFFLINTYIIFSWDVWWYGGGFGQRAMIPSYVLLALPLAALLEYVQKFGSSDLSGGKLNDDNLNGDNLGDNWKLSPKGWKVGIQLLVAIPILFCVWLNIHQTWQAHAPGGGFETENMTKAYYWKIFGKTHTNPEWRILLDTDEEFLGEAKNLRQLYSNDFESETDSVLFNKKNKTSGFQAAYLNNEVQFSPIFSTPIPSSTDADWIRATANFFIESKEWNYWMMTQFIISLEKGDHVIKSKMIRVQRLLGERNWRKISVVLKIPKSENFDTVKVKLWNAGGTKELWMDDLVIEAFKE